MTEARTANGPAVSVVIIFLDGERFIEEAIRSVFAQTWRRWELLLVDDGSTDASPAIARDWAARHPGIVRCLEHEGHRNRGMSVSRNLGVAQARGAYVAFLDADDVYLPEKLERQVALLDAHHEVDAVFGDSLYWYGWTGDPSDERKDSPRRLLIAPGVHERGELLAPLVRQRAFTPATCSVLVRRAAFERVGGFEERFRGMYEDQAFFFKLFLHSRTLMTADILDCYRQHPDSHCAVAMRAGEYRSDDPSPARRRFLDWLGEYLESQRHDDPRLRSLVRLERWLQRHPAIGGPVRRATVATRRAWIDFRGRLARRLAS